jgi:uncharacterized surface protein with fasciclin (FAS1) repeats
MKFLSKFALGLVAVTALTQIASAQSRDLVDTALATQKFNLFLSLAGDAGLTFELKNPGPFTVYAPTDAAISAKYSKTQLDALRANPRRLREILLHHVVAGRFDAATTIKMKSIRPMSGPSIPTSVVEGRGMLGGAARFVITNVNTSNGVLHGIDQVLVP